MPIAIALVRCGFDMDEYISYPTNVCSHPAPHLASDHVRRGDRQLGIYLDVEIIPSSTTVDARTSPRELHSCSDDGTSIA